MKLTYMTAAVALVPASGILLAYTTLSGSPAPQATDHATLSLGVSLVYPEGAAWTGEVDFDLSIRGAGDFAFTDRTFGAAEEYFTVSLDANDVDALRQSPVLTLTLYRSDAPAHPLSPGNVCLLYTSPSPRDRG